MRVDSQPDTPAFLNDGLFMKFTGIESCLVCQNHQVLVSEEGCDLLFCLAIILACTFFKLDVKLSRLEGVEVAVDFQIF